MDKVKTVTASVKNTNAVTLVRVRIGPKPAAKNPKPKK